MSNTNYNIKRSSYDDSFEHVNTLYTSDLPKQEKIRKLIEFAETQLKPEIEQLNIAILRRNLTNPKYKSLLTDLINLYAKVQRYLRVLSPTQRAMPITPFNVLRNRENNRTRRLTRPGIASRRKKNTRRR